MSIFKFTEKEKEFLLSRCGFTNQMINDIEKEANGNNVEYRLSDMDNELPIYKILNRDKVIQKIGRYNYAWFMFRFCESTYNSLINDTKERYSLYAIRR